MRSTRRDFIHLSSAVLATAMLPRLGAAPAKGKARPIGFSLYGMKSLPVLEALDHCKRIGYDNVEVCLMKGFPTELGKFSAPAQREVRDRLKSNGLELSSLLIHNLPGYEPVPTAEKCYAFLAQALKSSLA